MGPGSPANSVRKLPRARSLSGSLSNPRERRVDLVLPTGYEGHPIPVRLTRPGLPADLRPSGQLLGANGVASAISGRPPARRPVIGLGAQRVTLDASAWLFPLWGRPRAAIGLRGWAALAFVG